ncbi:hypothetical protein J5I70_25370 [Escherichia coli]|uniref:hypothetical protein n=1 Tax=Escherichia coli TaxID=562 RepID=UPI0016B59B0D|nr:hypothetical protein [Escherichia coli]EFJ8922664.1 hypothetical protein [Escherichia coli]MDX5601635.1 hypothetical protein [Escherichia coli]HAL7180133.1 hypothetical protein [Escherichia coli]
MKKICVFVCAATFSMGCLAGGGDGNWQPSVSPDQCYTYAGKGVSFFWNPSQKCQEVIDKGYAKGVQLKVEYARNDLSNFFLEGRVAPGQAWINAYTAQDDIRTVYPRGQWLK